MKMNKTGLCLAVITALGATNAYAFVTTNIGVRIAPYGGKSADKPVYFAKERNLETSAVFYNQNTNAPISGTTADTAGGDLDITFPTQPSYAVNTTNTLFVKITLLKGAKFGSVADPRLICLGGASKVSGALQAGGKGTSSVSFSLPNNFTTTGDSGVCTLVASSYAGISTAGLQVSAVVRYKNGAQSLSASYKGTAIAFATGTQFKVVNDKTQVTATVASESKKFTTTTKLGSGTVTPISQQTAYLGTVKYGKATALVDRAGVSVTNIRYANTAKSYLASAASIPVVSASLIIEGAPLAAGSKIFLTTGMKGCSANNANSIKSAALNGANSITIAGLLKDLAGAKSFSGGVSICMMVDGTKAIDQGQITVSFSPTARSSYTPIAAPLKAFSNLALVKQDGTTLRILNIPPYKNPELGYVRLYNPNSQTIKVTGSLYTMDGKQVGTTQTIDAAIPGFGVKVLDKDALKTIFGAEWDTKATLRLDANTNNFKAMGTIRDATGTLINASGSTKN